MVGEGWADFHRDLRAGDDREALIVDVACQPRRPHLAARRGEDRPAGDRLGHAERQPAARTRDVPRGPVVAVADEFAGSDGDIVTAAIQACSSSATVVGARTWGGVIGIDGWHRLVNGTSMTIPKSAFWFSHYGWGVENHGVDPDVEVIISPLDWAEGRDPQLATAVRLAVEALRTKPAAHPPDTLAPALPAPAATAAASLDRSWDRDPLQIPRIWQFRADLICVPQPGYHQLDPSRADRRLYARRQLTGWPRWVIVSGRQRAIGPGAGLV